MPKKKTSDLAIMDPSNPSPTTSLLQLLAQLSSFSRIQLNRWDIKGMMSGK